jgi:integrase
MKTLSPEQAKALLEAARGDRLEAFYVLAVTTGMRLDELLALRWQDIDLDTGSLQVRGTLSRSSDGLTISEPKTHGSRRHVALGGLAVEALRRHRTDQNAERLFRGADWEDQGLVFANEVGKPLRTRTSAPIFHTAARKSMPSAYSLPRPAPHGRHATSR